MGKTRKIKKLRGTKLKIKVANRDAERMREHSNEMQKKSNEQTSTINWLVDQIAALKLRI